MDGLLPGVAAPAVLALRPHARRHRLAAADGRLGTPDEWDGPVPVVDDPDVTGGADYSTLVRGKPWDFSTADDYIRLDNATGGIENGQLVATNTGPVINDPGVMLRVPQAFLGDQFHRMTVRWSYEGDFNLEDKPGGGANARIMWRIAGTPLRADGLHNEVSRDITMFPDERSFTLDLKTNPPSAAVDPRHGSAKIGWAGQRIEMVRFDPNEDRGARRWRVDEIRLAGDDAGDTSFDVRLRDANPAPGRPRRSGPTRTAAASTASSWPTAWISPAGAPP